MLGPAVGLGSQVHIGNGQQKLRDDFVKALEVTQKTISEATVQYVNDRLSGQPAQQGQLQTSTGPRGVLDGIFDKIGPAINKAVDRWADTANLPFTGSQAAPAATSEIVDLERQVRNVFELQYRNNMRKFVASGGLEMVDGIGPKTAERIRAHL